MSKLRWVALATFLALGGTGSRADAGDPCKLAVKGDSPVAKACSQGGFDAAKKLMEKMRAKVNSGRATRISCNDCHDHGDDSRYDTLTKDGRERFKGFLAEYDKKK